MLAPLQQLEALRLLMEKTLRPRHAEPSTSALLLALPVDEASRASQSAMNQRLLSRLN